MPSGFRAIEAALDAVIFDFDGVVLESVDVKTEAFRALFADHPGEIESILELHERHGGVSRYVKFDMIYRDVLCQPLALADRDALGRRFEALALQRVLACAMVPGARELLDGLRGRVAMAVVSGTPDDELAAIVARRGLAPYFAEVHGGSRQKREIIGDMMRAHGWRPDRVVVLGDAMTDYDAAVANGIVFIGRVADGKSDPFPAGTATIADLRGFAATAKRVLAMRAAAK